jgi:hypothetical protein
MGVQHQTFRRDHRWRISPSTSTSNVCSRTSRREIRPAERISVTTSVCKNGPFVTRSECATRSASTNPGGESSQSDNVRNRYRSAGQLQRHQFDRHRLHRLQRRRLPGRGRRRQHPGDIAERRARRPAHQRRRLFPRCARPDIESRNEDLGATTSALRAAADLFGLNINSEQAPYNIGVGATASHGETTAQWDLIDINGDGLPDFVQHTDGAYGQKLGTAEEPVLDRSIELAGAQSWGDG